MLVVVGSQNPVKIRAVENVFKSFPELGELEVIGIEVNSRVREQPIGKIETYTGARTRSKGAFDSIDSARYGIGIESGIETIKLGRDNIYKILIACSIYDGKRFFSAEGSSYEIPEQVAKLVLDKNIMVDTALYQLGFTEDERIGYKEGLASLLTNGRIKRQQLVEEGVRNCLAISLNKKHFHK